MNDDVEVCEEDAPLTIISEFEESFELEDFVARQYDTQIFLKNLSQLIRRGGILESVN